MKRASERKLPVGIQSFTKIRDDGYVYVDKTDLVWELANRGDQFCYLSRPRRFGKSLLVDTLQTYLEGRKEYFEELKIMQLENEWVSRPVIRLDMSRGGASAATLRSYLDICFNQYETTWGITPKSGAHLADRLDAIITTAHHVSGQQVAVLIDEYDSPLQHSWKTPQHDGCTDVYREVFAILKADDAHEKLVFITGITKFTQISLFSVLNNLSNISFLPQYAALCGITEEEIDTNFAPELQRMSEMNGWSNNDTRQRLKQYYDGYHFSKRNMVDVYNPFSLVNALSSGELSNYWASSGATSLIPKFINDAELHIQQFGHCSIMTNSLETSDVTDGGPELFLYQSGYLTIKQCDEFGYILGFPNKEVQQALYEAVLPALQMRRQGETQSLQANLYRQLGMGQVAEAMASLKALIADTPYSNRKMQGMGMEERYRLVVSTILNAIGLHVEVERMLATGRIDVLAETSRYIYVMELKLSGNGGLESAASQIRANRYTAPFEADARQTIALAIELDDQGKGLVGWKVVE